MQFKLSVLLCILLATFLLPQQLLAVSIKVNADEDTLTDQEPDDVADPDSDDGSAEEQSPNALTWVLHTQAGKTHQAKYDELNELEAFISQHRDEIVDKDNVEIAASVGLSQMEDGPFKLIEEEDKKLRKPLVLETPREEIIGQYLKEIVTTYYYPEYGVGILENSCTAFMIGPKHALTTANCVYNHTTDVWEEDLDFWRGRNGDQYLEKMKWNSVLIPYEFYSTGKPEQNWALIKFDSESPVWLRIAHSKKLRDVAMTVYGYLPDDHPYGTMYNSICRSDPLQPHEMCLDIQCGTDQKFSGGPVLKGYNFQRSKMPLVYAISVSYDYSYAHRAINIHEDLFWSLCYFMKKEGHDAECGERKY